MKLIDIFSLDVLEHVWNRIKDWLRVQRSMTTIPMAIKWLLKDRPSSAILRKARWVGLVATIYHLWNARSCLIFEDRPFDVRRLVRDIKQDVFRVIYSLYLVQDVVTQLGM